MTSHVGYSFSRLSQFFDNSRVALSAVIFLLVIHTGLLMYSAYAHSPTLNEPGHLVAGLSHWKFGRFDLYRVNPPLVRMVASVPVATVGYEEDWSMFYEGPGARPVFALGEDFVAANGHQIFFLMMIARWACIPFSWLGAIVCYLWARDLCCRQAGLLACFTWCFEPNILAHGSLITPDAHATALGLTACYTFWRWLKKPTWLQAALTGAVLGLAELAKTTLILFYPLWPMLWIIYRWQDRGSMNAKTWGREAGMIALRMGVSLYVINLGYGFEGSFRQLGDFHFVSQLFNGHLESAETSNSQSFNRFRGTPLSQLPMPFPENYLLGIDVQQRDFEDYGRPSYLRGKWQDHGWYYYYIYAAAIKMPSGLLCITGFGFIYFVLNKYTSKHTTHNRDIAVLTIPAMAVLVVASLKAGFNEHFRYIMPSLPLLFILTAIVPFAFLRHTQAQAASNLITAKEEKENGASTNFRRQTLFSYASPFLSLFVTWSALSSIWIYPHSLSYFNEFAGGPANGPHHLLGSNVDWGQDLRYAINRRRIDPCLNEIAYYGSYNPTTVYQDCQSNTLLSNVAQTACKHITVAASVNTLWGDKNFKRGMPEHSTCDLMKLRQVSEQAGRDTKMLTYAMRILEE